MIETFATMPLPPPPKMLPLDDELREQYRKSGELEQQEKIRREAWDEHERQKTEFVNSIKEMEAPSKRLYQELNDTLEKNRFWIGDNSYLGIKKYVDISQKYLAQLSRFSVLNFGRSKGNDLRGDLRFLNRERLRLRANITKIRDRLLTISRKINF